MKLTEEQIKILSAYEQHFDTAINGNWSRYPGVVALDEMAGVLEAATGEKRNINYNCQSCVLHFLQEVGSIYYQAKEAYLKAVESLEKEAAPVPKVAVKTGKK